jgi:hypothetical protein
MNIKKTRTYDVGNSGSDSLAIVLFVLLRYTDSDILLWYLQTLLTAITTRFCIFIICKFWIMSILKVDILWNPQIVNWLVKKTLISFTRAEIETEIKFVFFPRQNLNFQRHMSWSFLCSLFKWEVIVRFVDSLFY